MAGKKTINPADVDDDSRYAVRLKRPVQVGRAWVRPGEAPVLKGRIIKEHADDVAEILGLAD